MKKKILLILASALCVAKVSRADFTFGEPTNLGPTVNSSAYDFNPSIRADGLELYFNSDRPGGEGTYDIWVSTRASREDDWGAATNLGPPINTPDWNNVQCISADGLELYYSDWGLWVVRRATVSDPWGEAENDSLINVNTSNVNSGPCLSSDGLSLFLFSWDETELYLSTRPTRDDPWSEPVNLGPTVNGVKSTWENRDPSISADGLSLIFSSDREGGYGRRDLWMTRRSTIDGPWSEPVNLGPTINIEKSEYAPEISADGRSLLFCSTRDGGHGDFDIWQVSIDPVVDLNGDGIVDAADMCIVVDNWGSDNSLCDVGPMPWGDGVVDVEDLVVISEHLFEEFPKKRQVTTVIIVRHAEKANGTLTEDGEKRAETLAHLLSHTGVSAIFSTNYTRTIETANNTAERLGITIQFYTSIQGVAELIKSEYDGRVVLVVGHSNTVSQTVEALGVSSAPQINGEYDNLFVVTIGSDGTASLVHLKYDIDPDL